MMFDDSRWLFALAALPPVAAFLAWRIAVAVGAAKAFSAKSDRTGFLTVQVARASGILLLIASIVLSLAGPRSGFESRPVPVTGADCAICLDVSNSMLAGDGGSDGRKTRLDAARGTVSRFLASGVPVRASLTVFKGAGETIVPMTDDLEYLGRVVSYSGPSMMTTRGTDAVSGLEAAISSFPSGTARARLIILLSDGDSDWSRLEGTIASSGIPVICIPFGSREGAYAGEGSSRRLCVPDFAALARVARISGGVMAESGSAVEAVRFVTRAKEDGVVMASVKRSLSPLFAGIAAAATGFLGLSSVFPLGIRLSRGRSEK